MTVQPRALVSCGYVGQAMSCLYLENSEYVHVRIVTSAGAFRNGVSVAGSRDKKPAYPEIRPLPANCLLLSKNDILPALSTSVLFYRVL
jgi:hypothetical protein